MFVVSSLPFEFDTKPEHKIRFAIRFCQKNSKIGFLFKVIYDLRLAIKSSVDFFIRDFLVLSNAPTILSRDALSLSTKYMYCGNRTYGSG